MKQAKFSPTTLRTRLFPVLTVNYKAMTSVMSTLERNVNTKRHSRHLSITSRQTWDLYTCSPLLEKQ